MLVEADFTEVQDQVDPGVYKVRIKEVKTGEWQGKDGKPDTKFLNWYLETWDEPEQKNNGRIIFHKTPYTGKGAFRLQEFYKAVLGEKLTKESSSFDTEMLLGKELEVTVIDGFNKQTQQATGYTEVKTVSAIH